MNQSFAPFKTQFVQQDRKYLETSAEYGKFITVQILDDAGWKMGSGNVREKDGQQLNITIWNCGGKQSICRFFQSIENTVRDILLIGCVLKGDAHVFF